MRLLALGAVLALALFLNSQPVPREQPGPLADGSTLLNSGWRIKPAGKQVPLGNLPMSAALSPDGKFLAILNGGYMPPSVSILSAATMQEIGRTPVSDGWLGLAFSPNGKFLYVGGGARASVFEFNLTAEGQLQRARTLQIVPEADRKFNDFIGDVAVSPDGRFLYAADLFHDAIDVINLQSTQVEKKFQTGRRPYRVLFHPDGKSFFVTSWADGTLLQHETENGNRLGMLRLGAHPTDMVWRKRKAAENREEQTPYEARLFVAAANTNSVYAVGVTESKELKTIETINTAMTPRHNLGMTPSALALSPDEDRLFIVCSDANAVAVADIADVRSRVLGFIPTGWYPTAVRTLPDNRLIVLNGRGLRSFPNPGGPNPTKRAAPVHMGGSSIEYVGRIQTGTASVIDPISDDQLEQYTKTVQMNSPYRDEFMDFAMTVKGSAIPSRPGDPSPIEHVIYIVKENRTYDQVLGDLGKGNGDLSLALFTEKISPNHHKLAREFVLFDNFYVNADVSADGHNWSTSAIANDYVEKMWPNSYGGRRKHYDYEGGEPAALPPAGYIWSNAASAGITMRNYGWWVTNAPKPVPEGSPQVAAVRDSTLARYTNMMYRGFDLDYPDTERAKVFIKDLAEFEASGKMPKLIFLRIGNDHTSGTAAGKIAPLSSFADNDHALGMVVEAVSKSRFWPATAIFVLEDDAQNGPDHVDSHRSPAFVLSPYTHHGIVDSTMYNTTSMLRTIELIVGLRPMTHFDAAARPMSAAFVGAPDLKSYTAETPRIATTDRNPAAAPAAARASRFDFTEADQADDDELNADLWRAIRKTEPPVPVRALFH
jgi:DNA-binding beta-propeller fold protein YncE